MSEVGSQPPFAVGQGAVDYIQRNIAELGLAGQPCALIGAAALRLEGYTMYHGRLDFFTTQEICGELAVAGGSLTYARETGPGGLVNELLVTNPDVPINSQTAHVLASWEAPVDLEEVLTYDTLVSRAQDVHGILTVNPITSLRWLCARGYPLDGSAAYRALRYIRQTESEYIYDALSRRANEVWPLRPRGS
jgi:hypothetical protein